jgi:hypothetical protein
VTGLMMHVLSHVAESKQKISVSDFANSFITNIPESDYTPWSKEVPGLVLPDKIGGTGVKDTVRYYVLPWLLVGLSDAYGHANFRGRIQSLLFVEPIIDQLDQFTAAMLAENRPWIASEYLISLQYLLGNRLI